MRLFNKIKKRLQKISSKVVKPELTCKTCNDCIKLKEAWYCKNMIAKENYNYYQCSPVCGNKRVKTTPVNCPRKK